MATRRDYSVLIFGFLCMLYCSTARGCPGGADRIKKTLNVIAGINGSVSFVIVISRPYYIVYELYKDSTRIGQLFWSTYMQFGSETNMKIELIDDTNLRITYRDIKEDDSGHYYLFDDYDSKCIYWAFYALDMSVRYNTTPHSYIEAGTTLNTQNLPNLPSVVKTRMNVTTTWHFGGEEVGSDGLTVQPWMNRLNITYSIKNVRNDTAEFNITLLVAFNKDIQLSINTLMLVYGETAPDVNCSAACNPSCIYHREKDNMALSNTSTLSLGQADLNISGEYVCVATNNEIQTSLETVLQSYYHDADVKIVPDDKLFFLTGTNDIKTIDCVFHCYPACLIEWYKDGDLLQQSQALYIEKIPSSRTGLYTCRAYHKEMNGTSRRTIHIYDHYEVTKTADDLKFQLTQTSDDMKFTMTKNTNDLKFTDHLQTGFMVFQSVLIVGLITYLLQQRFGWCACPNLRQRFGWCACLYLRQCPSQQAERKLSSDNNSTTNTSGIYIDLQPRTSINNTYGNLETDAITSEGNQRTDIYENMVS